MHDTQLNEPTFLERVKVSVSRWLNFYLNIKIYFHNNYPIKCRKWQHILDKSTVHIYGRWIFSAVLFAFYLLRVYLLQGWYIITYGLGIFMLNLLIGFLSPQVFFNINWKFIQYELNSAFQKIYIFRWILKQMVQFYLLQLVKNSDHLVEEYLSLNFGGFKNSKNIFQI